MRAPSLVRVAILLLLGFAGPSYGAAPSGDASVFVAKLAHSALRAGGDKTLSADDRQHAFSALLDDDFDLQAIARFVLGRYWQSAKEAERQEFAAAFRDFMVRVYSQRFTEYRVESFRVVGQRAESPTSTLVDTEITQSNSGQVVKVEWRVVSHDGYKVIDMSVGGVSMVLTQREEFASSLQREGGGVASLVRQMNMRGQPPR